MIIMKCEDGIKPTKTETKPANKRADVRRKRWQKQACCLRVSFPDCPYLKHNWSSIVMGAGRGNTRSGGGGNCDSCVTADTMTCRVGSALCRALSLSINHTRRLPADRDLISYSLEVQHWLSVRSQLYC